jgi:predicted kinase
MYTSTRYKPIVKLAQLLHVYTYVELVAVFATVRTVCDARAARRRRSATGVVAKPVSASRRELSITWRPTYFLGVVS